MSVSPLDIGGRSATVLARLPKRTPRLGKKPGIGDYLQVSIDTRLREMLEHEDGTREGTHPESLHQMRVAVRRMRSVLKDHRRHLDREWTDSLRTELGWLARALGDVRDLDVLLGHFRDELERLDAKERKAAGPLLTRLSRKRGGARRKLLRALDSQRYTRLVSALADTAVDGVPTLTVESGNRPPTTPAEVVGTPLRKLTKEIGALPEDPSDDELHALRIYGKRLRYATEMVRGTGGKRAKRLVKATKALQDVLGEHQDACVARDEISAFLETRVDVPTAFAVGRLMEREQQRRHAAREQWGPAWRAVRKAGTALVD